MAPRVDDAKMFNGCGSMRFKVPTDIRDGDSDTGGIEVVTSTDFVQFVSCLAVGQFIGANLPVHHKQSYNACPFNWMPVTVDRSYRLPAAGDRSRWLRCLTSVPSSFCTLLDGILIFTGDCKPNLPKSPRTIRARITMEWLLVLRLLGFVALLVLRPYLWSVEIVCSSHFLDRGLCTKKYGTGWKGPTVARVVFNLACWIWKHWVYSTLHSCYCISLSVVQVHLHGGSKCHKKISLMYVHHLEYLVCMLTSSKA